MHGLTFLQQFAAAPANKHSLGDGWTTFKLDGPLPTLPSVPTAVSYYNRFAQSSGVSLSGGHVAPTNSAATLPQHGLPWNPSLNLHRSPGLVISLPISPHAPAHSPSSAHRQPPQQQIQVQRVHPPQSRRVSSVYGAAYPVAPPPPPALRQLGPTVLARRASYDQRQRQELASLAGIQMPAIATPRIPRIPSLGTVGGGVEMGTGGMGGFGYGQLSSPPPPLPLAAQPRPTPLRRPSAPPYIYSPERVEPEPVAGGGGQWPLDLSSHEVVREITGATSAGPQQWTGLVADEPTWVQSVARQQQAGLPRARTPFGPKSANQLPRGPGLRLIEVQSPVEKEQQSGRVVPSPALASTAVAVRPTPGKKRSSSGSVSAGITKRVTRSAKEEEGQVQEESKEGEKKKKTQATSDEANMNLDAEGSVEPEGVRVEETVAEAAAVSPRAHLKRQCTSPSFFEAHKGTFKPYVDVGENVKEENE